MRAHTTILRYTAPFLILLYAGLMVWSGGAFGGDLYPSGSPGTTMKSLQDIYDQAAQTYRAVRAGDALLFFPYLLERSGTVSSTQYTFDSTIYLVLTGPQREQGLKSGSSTPEDKVVPPVTVRLYLYSNNGMPATAMGGTPVANPASFELSPESPKATISVETLIQNAGGFASAIFVGYGILTISSGDWNDVSVEALIVNAHTGPGDVVITPLKPVRIQNSQFKGVADTLEPASTKSSSQTGKQP